MDIESPKSPEHLDNTTLKKSTFGAPAQTPDRTGPTDHYLNKHDDTEVDRAIDDAKCADQEILIRDENGKVFPDNNTNSNTLEDNVEISDLDLASNLSSSTESQYRCHTQIKETDKT